jgi:small subunit ribosomal protein S4
LPAFLHQALGLCLAYSLKSQGHVFYTPKKIMSRYLGPHFRIARRLGTVPGLCSLKTFRKPFPPGQHGRKKQFGSRFKQSSAYRLRLLAKQKLRFNYHITERQLVNYVKRAKRINGPTGRILLTLLEMRLDNIVYRMGMARTIVAARQLVNHGHILVNQQKVNIPSYHCHLKDTIEVKKDKASRRLVRGKLRRGPKKRVAYRGYKVPRYLSFNPTSLTGVVKNEVPRKQVRLSINELLVVEYYSRS